MHKFKNLKIIFISIFLFIIHFSSYANDDFINDIEINGAQRIDVDTVISYSNVKLGEVYTEELGNQILKDLFDTNLFSNIEISFTEDLLLISIKENPTIV